MHSSRTPVTLLLGVGVSTWCLAALAAPIDMVCKGSGTSYSSAAIQDWVLQIDLDAKTATFEHPSVYLAVGPQPVQVSDTEIAWTFNFRSSPEWVRNGFTGGKATFRLNRVTGRLEETLRFPPPNGEAAGIIYQCQRAQRLL